ncbi:MAG: hypothetical protein F6J87_18715 [Spirulina sp. SIO3F2]|nr:hypothetical protein [Spirulina sp. SIO3F2]
MFIQFSQRFTRLFSASLPLAIATLCTAAPLAIAQTPFRFVAIGDMPYSEAEQDAFNTDIRRAISAADVPFVVHYGDLKGGGESCTDALLTARRNDIESLHPDRVFYTPGDNEWTDCDRDFLDVQFSELDRLAKLRDLFFREPMAVPADWDYARQPNFSENARWQQENVIFLTLHVVGTNNGRQEILLDDPAAAIALVNARDEANRVWVEQAFEIAQQESAKAVVIVTQADVSDPDGTAPCTPTNPSDCDGYLTVREQIIAAAAAWGQPVLFVHGDTNPYCLDQEFGGEQAPKLWRLNAWGDFQSPPDATEITIQSGNAAEPFVIQTLMGQQAPTVGCQPES